MSCNRTVSRKLYIDLKEPPMDVRLSLRASYLKTRDCMNAFTWGLYFASMFPEYLVFAQELFTDTIQ
jgi:hypothetical protein